MARYHRNDGLKRGALIEFKDGLTTEECKTALRQIEKYLRYPYGNPDVGDYIREFDPMEGSPVWYVP